MKNFDEQAQRKVDYNNSSGREKEIEKNLWEGINNDKNIREEVTLGAKEMFRSRYGYNAADAGKKALIDKVWNDARKRMPASGVFQADDKPKEPLVYDAKTGEYKPRSELIAEAQKEANSGKWSIQQSNRDTSNDPKVQSYVAMEQAREYENFRNRGMTDIIFGRPLVNKIENSFAGTDWNPFDDPKVQPKKTGTFWGDVKEELGASFANTVGKAGSYVLDKVGRTITTPITSDEDPEKFKQRTRQYDIARTKRHMEIANIDWGQEANQDTGLWGAAKQTFRGAGRNLNAMMEDMARKSGNHALANFFGENSDAMGIEMRRHSKENPDTLGENLLAGGINLLGAIVYGTAGSALGGGGALAGATAFGYSQEYGSMKTELIDA